MEMESGEQYCALWTPTPRHTRKPYTAVFGVTQ